VEACLPALIPLGNRHCMDGMDPGIVFRTIASTSQTADRWPRSELHSLDGPRTKRQAPDRRTVAPVAMLTGPAGGVVTPFARAARCHALVAAGCMHAFVHRSD